MGVHRSSGRGYINSNDKAQVKYENSSYENAQLNNDKMTVDELVNFVQADLTFTGLMPKILPDLEILRIIKEHALQWFYKNYQWALIKSYYKLDRHLLIVMTILQMASLYYQKNVKMLLKYIIFLIHHYLESVFKHRTYQ